jgi:type I restriction enzyme, R subunit
MSQHREISFENDICEHLATNGWLYQAGDAQGYDRERALFAPDVISWVKASQPKVWEALSKSHGASAESVLLERLRKQMNELGTLAVLRNGIELTGIRGKIDLAQFKPAMAMNPDLETKYAANRLRVVRQLRYSLHNENAIDLGLFLNGLPIATVELKTDFTQCVDDAIDQYRFDRHPKPKGQNASEPLLEFPRGALVHFAVSNSEVFMTTLLSGTNTSFLPFNQGDNQGKGNPVNPSGHKTAYLWEKVWQRDSLLEIIGRFLVSKKDDKKKLVGYIFPRYHQLDAARSLVAKVLEEGAGHKYLIQHSAGSGKTNTIAWSAHFLSDLHDAKQNKIFDTILVVSDRTVLDSQLRDAMFEFERTLGVVASISGESQSKSGELAASLAGGSKIVVCTVQTFPFALKSVQELAATKGKRFAVIADEAHSSQSGDTSAKLKQLLSLEEQGELADGGEVSTEDILAANMSARTSQGVTFVAFTATPKPKTLEIFGRPPNPSQAAGPENIPAPFHVYSMRQAIEEGFILDVLKNYTPYKLAFKLANDGKELDSEVEKSAAMKGIMRWVRLHDYNISQKVQIVIEHFRENVAPLLNGHAKAMVVVGSRKEAVRWHLAMDKYIKSQGYKLGALVAFSGEVNDPESGTEPFTETSRNLNPNLKGRDIRDAFKTDEYQILLVANKFQTGFDQPLLCGMYVDKRLAGIQAVQTLSRLNRAYKGELGFKDTTFILDFINDPEEVLKAFKTYYATAELETTTDPNLVYDLRAKLDATGNYDDFEVNRVVEAELKSTGQAALSAAIAPVADRLLRRFRNLNEALIAAKASQDSNREKSSREEMDALLLFKQNMVTYLRVYTFLSQIFDYGNNEVEKRAIFFRRLLPLLDFGRERQEVDLSKVILTHHKLKDLGRRNLPLSQGEADKLKPMTDVGSAQVKEPEMAYLAEILAKVNDLFEGEVTDDDKLVYVNNVLKSKLLESETLKEQATNNTKEQFVNSPDLNKEILNAIMDALSAHNIMSRQALDSEKIREGLKGILLGPGRLYEALRVGVSL